MDEYSKQARQKEEQRQKIVENCLEEAILQETIRLSVTNEILSQDDIDNLRKAIDLSISDVEKNSSLKDENEAKLVIIIKFILYRSTLLD